MEKTKVFIGLSIISLIYLLVSGRIAFENSNLKFDLPFIHSIWYLGHLDAGKNDFKIASSEINSNNSNRFKSQNIVEVPTAEISNQVEGLSVQEANLNTYSRNPNCSGHSIIQSSQYYEQVLQMEGKYNICVNDGSAPIAASEYVQATPLREGTPTLDTFLEVLIKEINKYDRTYLNNVGVDTIYLASQIYVGYQTDTTFDPAARAMYYTPTTITVTSYELYNALGSEGVVDRNQFKIHHEMCHMNQEQYKNNGTFDNWIRLSEGKITYLEDLSLTNYIGSGGYLFNSDNKAMNDAIDNHFNPENLPTYYSASDILEHQCEMVAFIMMGFQPVNPDSLMQTYFNYQKDLMRANGQSNFDFQR